MKVLRFGLRLAGVVNLRHLLRSVCRLFLGLKLLTLSRLTLVTVRWMRCGERLRSVRFVLLKRRVGLLVRCRMTSRLRCLRSSSVWRLWRSVLLMSSVRLSWRRNGVGLRWRRFRVMLLLLRVGLCCLRRSL